MALRFQCCAVAALIPPLMTGGWTELGDDRGNRESLCSCEPRDTGAWAPDCTTNTTTEERREVGGSGQDHVTVEEGG